jgi:acyl-CoA reductase-like NAD-dependent aldehyde dehydrogenase
VIEEHANYIDGVWRPALAEHVFEISAAGDRGRPFARFPRSSARDVEAAVSAAAAAEPAWRDRALETRFAIVARALALLSREPDPDGRVAHSLGLAVDELARDRIGFSRSIESELGRARQSGHFEPGGIQVVLRHWSELWLGPVQHVLAALLAGRTVVLFSDPHVPFIAESLARALEASAVPRGVLALVHDDRDTCLDAALVDTRIDTLRASAPPARLRHIERRAQGLRARDLGRESDPPAGGARAADRSAPSPRGRFGAGLDHRRGPELDLCLLRSSSYVVTRSADPAAAAAEIIERAFGRARSLSGQRPGSVGRVLCHERQFSRFSAELLEQLALHPDAAAPLCARETAELDHLRRACELGLDEGATLVHSRREAAPPPSRDRRAEAMLWPAVFTNVEEHMRIAWLGRPAPVVCLMRVASDERGALQAQEIDRDPAAEDLSGSEEAAEVLS